jgi:hypothetical protein
VTAWDPHPDNVVRSIVAAADRVYIAGEFRYVGAGPNRTVRNRLAAVDLTTGALLPWDPSADDVVSALALRDSMLYVGG